MSNKVLEIKQYKFVIDLYYSDRHIWFRKDLDGSVTVGLDDLGQKLAGRILTVRLPAEGTSLELGKIFGTMESAKWVERLKSSVTGTVKAVNSRVRSAASLVNEDPYGEGWMIKIAPTSNLDQELSKLATGDSLRSWAVKEVEEKESLVKK